MRDRTISELADVEFTGSLGAAFYAYSQRMQTLGRRLEFELEIAASDSEAAMSRLKGHPLLFGIDARIRARIVAKRLKRAQELARGLGTEGRKFHAAYEANFIHRAGR